MNFRDYYGVNLFTAEKFGKTPKRFKIAAVKPHTIEKKGEEPQTRLHLVFDNQEQELRLNMTNANILAAAFGEDTSDWEGKTVELYVTKTEFMGKQKDGLRLRVVKK